MAFDQTTRNRLQRFVTNARTLLSAEFTRQLQNEYGLNPETGEVSDLSKLTFLDDARRETARVLRETMDHYLAATPGADKIEILSRIVREQAFTILNRMAALRMAEARGILMESIGNGYQSKGFQLYSYMAGSALGESGKSYRTYIFSLFDEFSLDLKVLFDRFSPQGRLFPKDSTLLELLDLINHPEVEPLWAEDETIGWIYQYFNSKEERKKMRDESSAPRNSRELAVRNQFFTPRYVVEFLTDNTLGRIWYEMTQGKTTLTESCRYLVRRPNEIFLKQGENAPNVQSDMEDLTQEEQLKEPVYVPFRSLKDPRDLKMLDPACGSMHFGLYAFDLFERIYYEAWDLEFSVGSDNFEGSKKFPPLNKCYDNKESFIQDVPRLIIENNIHGVDIDPRAVQIAGLSLWLRAQKSWQDMKVNPDNRPQVQKSNIVCAEPMPGEKEFLREFTSNLQPRVIGQLVEIIFDKMQLAGEAGSLLKIEEEIQDAIKTARTEYNEEIMRKKEQGGYLPGMAPARQPTLFDFADLPDDEVFWDQAEHKILDALRDYAERTERDNFAQKRLFAQDAANGFAFIDLCRKRFDVVVMNPPFGESTILTTKYLGENYNVWAKNLLCSFIIRTKKMITKVGLVGMIFDRTAAIKSSYKKFRLEELDDYIQNVADTGWGVLDANVETTGYILSKLKNKKYGLFFDLRDYDKSIKGDKLLNIIANLSKSQLEKSAYIVKPSTFIKLPNAIVGYYFDELLLKLFSKLKNLSEIELQARQGHALVSEEHFRLYWEIPVIERLGKDSLYSNLYNGSEFNMFYCPLRDVAKFGINGEFVAEHKSVVLRNPSYQYLSGVGYGKRGDILDAHILPSGFLFTSEGQAITGINNKNAMRCLGFLNSSIAQYTINQYCGQHKHCGYVNLLPVPSLSEELNELIFENLLKIIKIKRKWLFRDETSLEYAGLMRFYNCQNFQSIIDHIENEYIKDISILNDSIATNDLLFEEAAGLTKNQQKRLKKYLSNRPSDTPWPDFERDKGSKKFDYSLTIEFISNFLGILLGRWDICYENDYKKKFSDSDIFTPLPVCPPGMLQNSSGFPVERNDVPFKYPLRIIWSGILVDDKGHTEDIITCIREVIEFMSKGRDGDMEQEVCKIMNIQSLREYFSKPSKFFADHLKRYSKSRRQAPIYWPLSTQSGSYTIWLYYHRLNDEILYTCVNNFIDPKLKQISQDTIQFRDNKNRSDQEEKDLEKTINFELELTDFKDELLRIAKFWKPNLNDGAQITAAPLWRLFQHKPWQKKLKETWGKLEAGDYDWAHLAYSIWPERVKGKCKKDKSLAIAHDLEELYEELYKKKGE